MISDPRLTDAKEQLAKGLITKTGYVLACCKALELSDPIAADRAWLASQLGLTVTALAKLLYRLRDDGLL